MAPESNRPGDSRRIRRRIGTPASSAPFRAFERSEESESPAEELFLSEYLAAIRREFEAAAIIAAPESEDVPQFFISDVECELVCAVSEVSDLGLRVTVDRASIETVPESMLQRIKFRLTDPSVPQTGEAAK